MSKASPLLAVGLLAVALGGCSDGDGPLDLGVGATPDLAFDAAVARAVDLGQGVGLAGTRILPGRYSLLGVTDDDQVVFYDAHGLVETLPLAGGALTSIDPDAQFVVLDGQSVFSWRAVGQTSLVGKLLAWSATSGLHEVAAASSIGDAAATSDGASLLFSDHASDDGRTIDFVLAHADGSSPTTVQSSRASGRAGCQPQLARMGARFVLASCEAAGDGGAGAARVVTIDAQSGAVTTLFDDVRPFWVADARGTRLLAIAEGGTALVRALDASGPATIVDADVADAQFLADGNALIYTTTSGALKRTSLEVIAPVTLVAEGARALRGLSPDEKWVIYRDQLDAVAFTSDLSLASTESPGPPLGLVDSVSGAVFGDCFTDKSSHVLYYADVDSDGAGRLVSRSLAGAPGTERNLGDLVWLSFAVDGSKIVYNDHWKATQLSGRADLRAIDLSGLAAGTPSVLLAAGAEQDFAFSASRDRVVYSYAVSMAKGGLYVAKLP